MCVLVCVGGRERQKGRGGYREPEREDKEKDIMDLQSCDYVCVRVRERDRGRKKEK